MTTTSRHRTLMGRRVKMTTLALLATATVAATITRPPIPNAEPDTSPTMAAHGVEAPLGAVPWSQVGPGWMLAMWSPVPGSHPGEKPSPGSPTYQTATTTLYQVDPRSGTKTTFTVNEPFTRPRYTRPDGKAVLLTTQKGLERVDLAGNHQMTYPVGKDFRGYLATPDGTRLVVGTASDLAVMGNDGVVGRALPIAGQKDCAPMRWWDTGSRIALANCRNSAGSQLWLVPIDGGTPTALTAPNNGKNGPDYGDLNAWQLPAGTYLQAAGACGLVFLAKLNGDGTTSQVSVPNVNSATVVVIGVNGDDLDLQAKAGCGAGQSLIDYNPASGTSTVLLGPPVNGGGVINALPYRGQK